MGALKLQDPKKVSAICSNNFNNAVSKINNEKLLEIDIKLKNSIKLDIVKLDKSKICPKGEVSPEAGLYRYLHQPIEQHRHRKREATDFMWNKNKYRLDMIVEDLGNYVLCYLPDGIDGAF